ncbi:MAG: hypothetical protein WDZ94_03950 [Patescibacteria group bacterium]
MENTQSPVETPAETTPPKKRISWYWYLIGGVLIAALASAYFNQHDPAPTQPPEEYAQTIRWDEWKSSDPEDNQLELTDELVTEMLETEYEQVAFLQYQPDEEFPGEEVSPLGIALVNIEEERTLAQITVDGLEFVPQEYRYAAWMLNPETENYRLLGPLVPVADQMGERPAWELLYGVTEAWPAEATIIVTQETSGEAPIEPTMPPLLAGQLDSL